MSLLRREIRFRIKHVENIGYFSQVKTSLFAGWRTIGKHIHGYGLYENDHIDFPLDSKEEAEERCLSFDHFYRSTKNTPSFTDFNTLTQPKN